MKKLIYLLVFIVVLAACSTNVKHSENLDPIYPSEVEITKGEFTYRLFTEKDAYDEYGDTAIFAELTYVGDEDSIEIYHSASPFYFPIEERTRNIKSDYAMNQPLISSTLKKDEPLREKYTFSGGYSDTDAPEYVEFIQTIFDQGFPKGNYVITGSAQFYIIHPIDTTNEETFDMNGTIEFTVADRQNH